MEKNAKTIEKRKDDGILNTLELPEPWCDPHKAFTLVKGTSWKDIKDVEPIRCLLVVDGKEMQGKFVAQTSGFRPFSLFNNAMHGRKNFDHRIIFKMKDWDVCVARVPQGFKNDQMLKDFEIFRNQVIKNITGTKISLEDVLLKLKELDVYKGHQSQKLDASVASNNNNINHNSMSGSEYSPEELEELKRKNKELEERLQRALEKYPEEYLCPILCDIMKDPVILKDGHTYERSAIEEWLKTHNTSPMTGARLQSKEVIPNYALKKMITTYLEDSASKNNNNNH